MYKENIMINYKGIKVVVKKEKKNSLKWTKPGIINSLILEYEDSLKELNLKDLKKIIQSNCFSLKEIELQEVDPR